MSAAALPALTRQRCWTHAAREAAARCPGCERFFCRECVTEHEGRFLCAACLRARTVVARPASRGRLRAVLRPAVRALQVAGGALLAWWCFCLLGRALTHLPTDFHRTSLWQQIAPDDSGSDEP